MLPQTSIFCSCTTPIESSRTLWQSPSTKMPLMTKAQIIREFTFLYLFTNLTTGLIVDITFSTLSTIIH